MLLLGFHTGKKLLTGCLFARPAILADGIGGRSPPAQRNTRSNDRTDSLI